MLTSSNISFVKRIDPITDCSASILFGCSSNLLFIRNDQIYSPSKYFYKGITYKYFSKKIKIKKKNISLKEIDNYSEILLIGSGKGVASVFKIPSLNWTRKNNKIFINFLFGFLIEN